jgi:hypothetical protein
VVGAAVAEALALLAETDLIEAEAEADLLADMLVVVVEVVV